MKKQLFLAVFTSFSIFAGAQNQVDSTRNIKLNEIVITSLKETSPQQTPLSSTIITPKLINTAQITSIKDLSGLVPNFFIPDYGSAMSSAVYIRGIGTRNSGQSMGLYVDNVPYFEKSTFDFDFYDIRQIEVLRGAQGTLYGRNAMGGVVNIYTLSPLSYQGTKVSVTGGNYGLLNTQASHYAKFNDKIGVSMSGYYNHDNGFFTNQYTHKSADAKTSAGGRVKLDWNINPNFKAQYAVNLDYVDETAFPYGLNDSVNGKGKTAQPNFNDESSYTRSMLTHSLFLQYKTKDFVLSSTTSHQYFKDDMKMDQDFNTLSYFTLQQKQKQNALNEEIILKSNSKSNYQWSFGVTGFLQRLDMDAPVVLKNDELKLMQRNFPPSMVITNTELPIPGLFNINTIGGALFHQSTLNNILVDGFSLTAGLRIDYEKVNLDYNTNSTLNIKMYGSTIPFTTTFKDTLSVHFSELMPKVALKYEWSDRQYVYANVSRGYKTGGYNVQMFADLVQKGLELVTQGKDDKVVNNSDAVFKSISYHPEYSWNYEVGGQCLSFENHLKTSLSLFYINVKDMQLTQFVPSGNGRMITNAGKVESKGIELSMEGLLGNGFSLVVNYGYAHATFTNYSDSINTGVVNPLTHKSIYELKDYKGKFVPYAPQHTVNVSGNYEHSFENSVIDQLLVSVQYSGVGKIYWTEANDISQNFYSLVNAKVGVTKGKFGLELWSKNLMNIEYNAFYFSSLKKTYFQKGKPLQMGVTIKMEL